jgi:hypothetical protein
LVAGYFNFSGSKSFVKHGIKFRIQMPHFTLTGPREQPKPKWRKRRKNGMMRTGPGGRRRPNLKTGNSDWKMMTGMDGRR